VTPARRRERKVLLLTGASGPIGSAFAERYGATYDIVAVRHRRPLALATQRQSFFDPFDATPAAKDAEPGKLFEITADLREPSEIARVVEVALARFGRIDVLVNAVGSFGGGARLLGSGLEHVTDLFKLNAVVPTAVAVRVALDFWRHHDLDNAARNRVVVNLSASAAVDSADRTFGRTFGATKAALNMLSLHLADELRPFNVRVVTVAPSPVPDVVTIERLVGVVGALIEGDQNGKVLLMWDDEDELV